MELIQLIGFIVTVIAFLYLMGRNLWELLIGDKNSSDTSQKQHSMFGMNFDDEDEEVILQKPVPQKKEHHYKETKQKQHEKKSPQLQPKQFTPKLPTNKWEQKPQEMPVLTYAATLNGRSKPSRGSELIQRLKSPQEMIVLAEIIGPPKSNSC